MLPVPNLKIGGLTYNALGRIILIVPTWADESDDGEKEKGQENDSIKLPVFQEGNHVEQRGK